MGIGDEIMVTGEVKRRFRDLPARAGIFDPRKGAFRWHPIWEGNPRISKPGQTFDIIIENAGGCRPYIVAKLHDRWLWKEHPPTAGEIFLTDEELEFGAAARGHVIIHPFLKAAASPNKSWGLERWRELVRMSPEIPWLEVSDYGEGIVPGAKYLCTPSFRLACGALARSLGAVLQEGGLHHAAAALGKKAVVIFGGFISPKCTGYNGHRNLFVDASYPLGCGMRGYCQHCADAMASITPEQVLKNLKELL